MSYLLRDGEADDGVSLRDVPCHHGRVGFHRLDGHIDGRRQAVCEHQRNKTPLLSPALPGRAGSFPPLNLKQSGGVRKTSVPSERQAAPKPQTLGTKQSVIVACEVKSHCFFGGVEFEMLSRDKIW